MCSDVLSPDISIRRDVGCKTVANMIKGKSPEEIRKLFNIVNDFTPEEEVRPLATTIILYINSRVPISSLQAQIKKENEWAEDR